jgi:SAM-dependent methyltransferase
MSLFRKLSDISRKRKIALFNNTFHPTEQTKILDVGAEIDPKCNSTLQFIDLYPWKRRISALNMSEDHIAKIKQVYPEIDSRVGDACALPWSDKSFDIVYSNAVIEHVGDFEKQKLMAKEIMRVGKAWFITTPNRWYPFEFHIRLPLVTWLPGNAYKQVGRIIRYSHLRKRYAFGIGRVANLRLMSARELRQCFSNSRIIKLRVTFMAETLIVVGGDHTNGTL